MFNPKNIIKDVPVTLLGSWLRKYSEEVTGESVIDPVAALAFIDDDADAVLKEKTAAAMAVMNNKTSLWDPHGFSNVMLILNGIPASADYVAAVDPVYINYGVWELLQMQEDLLIGPESLRFIEASLKTFDYVYPPDELTMLEDIFLEKYVEACNIKKLYYEVRDIAGDKVEQELDSRCAKLDIPLFYKYHTVRLLAADSYLNKMKKVYEEWKIKLEV